MIRNARKIRKKLARKFVLRVSRPGDHHPQKEVSENAYRFFSPPVFSFSVKVSSSRSTAEEFVHITCIYLYI